MARTETIMEPVDVQRLAELAEELTAANEAVRAIETKRRDTLATFRNDLKEARAEVERIEAGIKTRQLEMKVPVVDVFDRTDGIVRTKRLDTGEFIPGLTRSPTPAERQIPMPIGAAGEEVILEWPEGCPFERGALVVIAGGNGTLYTTVDAKKKGDDFKMTIFPYGADGGKPRPAMASELAIASGGNGKARDEEEGEDTAEESRAEEAGFGPSATRRGKKRKGSTTHAAAH